MVPGELLLQTDGVDRINESKGRGPCVRFEDISLELSSFSGCQFDFAKNGILVLTFDGYTGTVTLKSADQQQQRKSIFSSGSEATSLGGLEDGASLLMDPVDYDMALSQLEQEHSPEREQQLQPAAAEPVSTVASPSPAEVLLFSSPSAVRQTCEGRAKREYEINDKRREEGDEEIENISSTSKTNGKAYVPSGQPSACQQDVENDCTLATLISPSSSLKNASHAFNANAGSRPATDNSFKTKKANTGSVPLFEKASTTSIDTALPKGYKNKRRARVKGGDGAKKDSLDASSSPVGLETRPRGKRIRRGRDEPSLSPSGRARSASVLTPPKATFEKEIRARGRYESAAEGVVMMEKGNNNANGVPVQLLQQKGAGGNGLIRVAVSPASSAASAWIASTTPLSPGSLSRSAKAQIIGEGGIIPMGRWGHSATMVSDTQMLVLGGQADDDAHQATLGDLHKFDFATRSWSRPMNCDSVPRAWHTASFIAGKNLLVIFGGERTVDGCPECLDDIMVLDTDIDLLYPPAISGKSPTARSGHSAAIIGRDLIVFGGVRGRKWQNNVAVLDTERWHWRHPTIDGSNPAPRSYHSATVVGKLMVVFGGNNQNESFDKVHVLDTGKSRWEWGCPEVVGPAPTPRTGHSAVLLPDGYTILIHGGWDPEDERGVKNFGDSYRLDTRLWEWSRGPETLLGAENAGLRVGHTALLARGGDEANDEGEKPSRCYDGVRGGWKAAFFGGQDGKGVRRSELALLSL